MNFFLINKKQVTEMFIYILFRYLLLHYIHIYIYEL